MGIFGDTNPTITDPDIISDIGADIDEWSCAAFLTYYKRVKKKYGKARAKEVFLLDFSRLGAFDNQYNFCKYDCDWMHFFRKEGIEMGWLASNLWCGVEDVSEAAGGAASTVKSVFTNPWIKGGAILAGVWFVGSQFGLFKNKNNR